MARDVVNLRTQLRAISVCPASSQSGGGLVGGGGERSGLQYCSSHYK